MTEMDWGMVLRELLGQVNSGALVLTIYDDGPEREDEDRVYGSGEFLQGRARRDTDGMKRIVLRFVQAVGRERSIRYAVEHLAELVDGRRTYTVLGQEVAQSRSGASQREITLLERDTRRPLYQNDMGPAGASGYAVSLPISRSPMGATIGVPMAVSGAIYIPPVGETWPDRRPEPKPPPVAMAPSANDTRNRMGALDLGEMPKAAPRKRWTCPDCGESNRAAADACFVCERGRP